MAWTQAQLAELEANMANGVLRTRDDTGQEVLFRTLGEMLQMRDMIRGELGQVANGGISVQFVGTSKGIC